MSFITQRVPGALRTRMTGYLEVLLRQSAFWVPAGEGMWPAHRVGIAVITPTEPVERGVQLLLLFLPTGHGVMPQVLEGLSVHGVVGNLRKPDMIKSAANACRLCSADVSGASEAEVIDDVRESCRSESVSNSDSELDLNSATDPASDRSRSAASSPGEVSAMASQAQYKRSHSPLRYIRKQS
ncbi:uncharacterized protein FIBRA_08435 [Fibroporia radiculosa]|uniref:Uncharacterized protein n=1 Tax=Fibroporia radiculosa TaxID=599839 RepID=J4GHE5_9APHY|nr:uncharacterized protein FIBRA_08435 [Fibroporia radiculosa]CCM06193.1 predicted protein [Fibroporia radiculosa]